MGYLVAVILLLVAISAGVYGFVEGVGQGLCDNDCRDTSRPELLLALAAVSLLASTATGVWEWRRNREQSE